MYTNNTNKPLALSMLDGKSSIVFYAFATEVVQTNTDSCDLESVEIEIYRSLIDQLNDQLGSSIVAKNNTNLSVSCMLKEKDLRLVAVVHADVEMKVTDVEILCNRGGLYARILLSNQSSGVYYTVKLISYI